MKRYVLLREDANTHQEMYFVGFKPKTDALERSPHVFEARAFASAADAYRFAAMNSPTLDWWHVGER